MATLTKGVTFGATETVTNTKLHNLVDDATISGIVNADIDASANIASTKLNLTGAGYITTGSNFTITGTYTFSTAPVFSVSPTFSVAPNLPADTVDAITEIKSTLKSGADATLVTGTKGTSGNLASWNADGDLVDSGGTKSLGSWASKSNNTAYLAATDGFVVANGYRSGDAVKCEIYTDGSNPPTTLRVKNMSAGESYYSGGCCPVKSGDYYKVYIASPSDAAATATYIYWIPLS